MRKPATDPATPRDPSLDEDDARRVARRLTGARRSTAAPMLRTHDMTAREAIVEHLIRERRSGR